MQLAHKTAIVTGAGSGIGRGIAHALAASGARVLVAGIEADGLRRTAQEITHDGGSAHPFRLDVRDPDQAQAAVGEVVERWGKLDIHVNNAGSTARKPFLDMDLAFFEDILRLNLAGYFICAQAAARQMVSQGSGGRIVQVSSNSGLFGGVGRAAYSASKAGVIALTQTMAAELGGHGILVNTVVPGPMRTERSTADRPSPAFLDRMSIKRFGEPSEVGAATVFLASDACSFTNGHSLIVDGGLTATGVLEG